MHGHTNVPSQYTFKLSPPLGEWVKRMRRLQKEEKLSAVRKQLLEDVGFEFEKPKTGQERKIVFSQVWNKAYLELCEYQSINGNIEVPDNYKHTPDSKCLLDMWIKRQRTAFKAGKLDNDLIEKLVEVGVDLAGRARPFGHEVDARWTSCYKLFKKFSEANGNCDVAEDDIDLGDWAKTQRDAYAAGKLNVLKKEMLQKINFNFFPTGQTNSKDPWDTRFSEGKGRTKGVKSKWDKYFEELKRFKANHGTTDVRNSLNADLAGWVKRQQRYQRDQTLKKDRYEKLKEFGFDFGGPAQARKSWDCQFQSLVEFKEKNGHMKVPTNYQPNPSLYFWIGTQRQSYKQQKLSAERIEKLTELGVDLSIQQSRERPKGKVGSKSTIESSSPVAEKFDRESYLSELWEKSYQEMVEYQKKFGNCKIPVNYTANPSLGAWAFAQRMAYEKNKLPDERAAKLIEIGFAFGNK